jgi:hypothetical protein
MTLLLVITASHASLLLSLQSAWQILWRSDCKVLTTMLLLLLSTAAAGPDNRWRYFTLYQVVQVSPAV